MRQVVDRPAVSLHNHRAVIKPAHSRFSAGLVPVIEGGWERDGGRNANPRPYLIPRLVGMSATARGLARGWGVFMGFCQGRGMAGVRPSGGGGGGGVDRGVRGDWVLL